MSLKSGDINEMILEVISCRKSLKGGGNLVFDLAMGSPMTNPPKHSRSTRELFDVKFRNQDDGRIYLCETPKFYRTGELQKAKKPSILKRFSDVQKLRDEISEKVLRVRFL